MLAGRKIKAYNQACFCLAVCVGQTVKIPISSKKLYNIKHKSVQHQAKLSTKASKLTTRVISCVIETIEVKRPKLSRNYGIFKDFFHCLQPCYM